MKEMICIVCPRGCRLKVDENTLKVSGNSCPKGEEYGKSEIISPVRTITGSVAIEGGIYSRLAVRTDNPFLKIRFSI
jgi:CxxC motif-containing protein